LLQSQFMRESVRHTDAATLMQPERQVESVEAGDLGAKAATE